MYVSLAGTPFWETCPRKIVGNLGAIISVEFYNSHEAPGLAYIKTLIPKHFRLNLVPGVFTMKSAVRRRLPWFVLRMSLKFVVDHDIYIPFIN